MHNIRRRSPFLPVNVDVTYQTRTPPSGGAEWPPREPREPTWLSGILATRNAGVKHGMQPF
jgi:hypothetical protein